VAQTTVYEMVTQRIIEQLEKGIIPWHKPWVGNSAINYKTRKPYRGINPILLPEGGEYLSFLQCKELGGNVKRGEKGHMIVFYKTLQVEDENNLGEQKDIPFLRYSKVFHITQCEGIESKTPPLNVNPDIVPIEKAQTIVDSYCKRVGVKVRHVLGSDRAYYALGSDEITLPDICQFTCAYEYASTSFHEAAHSTGHRSRLNRKVGASSFGSHVYSKEELCAEIASVMLMNKTGIELPETFDNSAAYIGSWLKKLKNDKTFIIAASSQAQKAADMILGVSASESNAAA